MSSDIKHRANFQAVRYANVWEDADILCEALAPRPGHKILSIASAGDNCFALLAEGAHVVAVDLSPAQLACTALKAAAIEEFEHFELVQFLGLVQSTVAARQKCYQQIRNQLSPEVQQFWDQRPASIAMGFVHDGKFEKYFQTFRKRVLPLIHSKATVEALFVPRSVEARREFFSTTWNTVRWRLLFHVFFSRFVLGRLGRDPEFFRYVKGSVSARLLARTEYAFVELDPSINPFLRYILLGNFTTDELSAEALQSNSALAQRLPRYLRPEVLPKVKDGLSRLELAQGTIEDVAKRYDGFNGYNLSDLFEYLSETACGEIYRVLVDKAHPGARLAYWNMLVPRSCPPALSEQVVSQNSLGESLFAKDQAFFYSAFLVDEVR